MENILNKFKSHKEEKYTEKIEHLEIDNELLKDKNYKLDDIAFKTTQENALISNRLEEFESLLDKTTDERNIYKETINIMCDKYNIGHNEVYDIIDQVKIERENKQRER